jgi:hypothetical protein
MAVGMDKGWKDNEISALNTLKECYPKCKIEQEEFEQKQPALSD